MNNHSVYYTEDEVSDARWILGTQHYLEHRVCDLMWATRVYIWLTSIISYVCRKFNDVSEFECNFTNTLNRVKEGELNFNDVP